jgi:hypothetical protein
MLLFAPKSDNQITRELEVVKRRLNCDLYSGGEIEYFSKIQEQMKLDFDSK